MSGAKKHQKIEETAGKLDLECKKATSMCLLVEDKSDEQICCLSERWGEKQPICYQI